MSGSDFEIQDGSHDIVDDQNVTNATHMLRNRFLDLENMALDILKIILGYLLTQIC